MSKLDVKQLTWAALIGRWVEFAQAAVGLADDGDGAAWKQIVPAVIGLQAVTMALGDLDELSDDQRALGMDRASILIDRHSMEIEMAFPDRRDQPGLQDVMVKARHALRDARKLYPAVVDESGESGA